jgi:peptide deformylase
MEKTELRIRVFGDPVLREKSKEVKRVTDRHRELLSGMARLMYEGDGIGLAAPQAGVLDAMIVVDAGSGLYKLINPKIVRKQGSQALDEGCLSVPGICIRVKRANKVKVSALDEFGKDTIVEAEGLLACVLQHEIDHLKGKLITDYASLIQRLKMKKKLAVLWKKSQYEKLSQPKTKSCSVQL